MSGCNCVRVHLSASLVLRKPSIILLSFDLSQYCIQRDFSLTKGVKMLKFMWPLLALIMPQVSVFGTAFINASQGPEAVATRGYFYVGGGYVDVIFPFISLPIDARAF